MTDNPGELTRLRRILAEDGTGDRALGVCRELIAMDDIDTSLLQAIAEIARDEDDPALQRRALELIIARGDTDAKRDAFERFGDLLFDTLGDRRGAVESWKSAAQLCDGSAAGQQHAQKLYERALETWADDAEARHELAELYIRSGDWSKIPDALRVLIRADQDLGRCVLLLLRLEESAVMARALGEFVSLVDELMDRLPRESPEQIRALARARARVLALDPARQADASKAYRSLIESFESDDDIRDFEAFVESRPGADDRHQDRRWLYQWRAAHSPRPADVLKEWARAEEEYGEPAAAIAVYEHLAETKTGRRVAQEALSRLKFHSGDMAGGLAAYRVLREEHGEKERAALDLRTARLLLEQMDRPVEAAVVLAPTLAMHPPIRGARELALKMLADPTVSDEVGARFAQIANTVDDASALHLFQLLVSGPMVSSARRRWLERIIELSPADPATALSAVLRGAMDLPESISLWEGAERIARSLGRPEIVARAYHRILDRHGIDSAIAEVLGRRMVAFEDDCAIGRLPSIAALEAAFSADPTNADCRDRLVQNYEDQAEWADAARVLGVAVNAVGDDRPLFRRLIEAYLRAGSDREALEALDQTVATRPADADLLSLRAGVRERTADYEGALSDLEHASLTNSAYVDTLFEMLSRMEGIVDRPDADRDAIRLADALIRLKRPNQARREVDRLLARSPHHVAGLSRLAALASDAGCWDLAAGSYRKLMLIAEKEGSQGDLARFAIAAADACKHAGTLGETREPLERALGILSQSPEMQLEFERLCRAMKEWPRLARVLVERAERAQEKDKADLLVRAARLLLEEGNDPAGALRVLGPVETTKPESLEAIGVWGRAQVAMGHAHRAIGVLYDAAERNRSNRSPVLANIYLEIGRAHLAVDEVVEAFIALESAFDVDSRTGDIAMLFGLVALDLGDEKTAERAFSSVTTLPFLRDAHGRGADAGTRALAFYHLASLASAKGDLAKARRLASRAVGVDPGNGPARALLAKIDSQTIAGAVPGK